MNVNDNMTGGIEPQKMRKPLWKRILLGGVFVLLGCVTLMALGVVIYNWRSEKAWDEYRKGLEAKGEKIFLTDMRPQPVPDEENFAMTPLFAPLFRYAPGVTSPQGVGMRSRIHTETDLFSVAPKGKGSKEPKKRSWRAGESTDLGAWQEFYVKMGVRGGDADMDDEEEETKPKPTPVQVASGQDGAALAVLKYLDRDKTDMDELRAALSRPHAVFPVHYEEPPFRILLPHAAIARKITRYATLSSVAKLHLRQSEAALTDLKVALRFSDALAADPILISHLVRIAMAQDWMQVVWEGAKDKRWTPVQLEWIQSQVEKLDWVEGGQQALRGERALANGSYELWVTNRKLLREDMLGSMGGDGQGGMPMEVGIGMMPSGLLRQNQIVQNQAMDEYQAWFAKFRPSPGVYVNVDPEGLDVTMKSFLEPRTPHNFMAALMTPAISNVLGKTKLAQVERDVALVGISLERYALAHDGKYPEALVDLVPGYLKQLPVDGYSGNPFKYRVIQGEGRVLLYSVGENGEDDGGRRVLKTGNTKSSGTPDDAVWSYAAAGDK